MKKIKLVPSLFEKAKLGYKKASTRLGIKEFTVGESEVVNNQTHESVPVFIHKIEVRKYKDIDDKLAQIEDYQMAEELKEALKVHYPDISDNDYITVVHFSIILFAQKSRVQS